MPFSLMRIFWRAMIVLLTQVFIEPTCFETLRKLSFTKILTSSMSEFVKFDRGKSINAYLPKNDVEPSVLFSVNGPRFGEL